MILATMIVIGVPVETATVLFLEFERVLLLPGTRWMQGNHE